MSNAAAGKRFEQRCKEYLESIGFTVDKARAALKFVGPGKFFSSPCDFFGAADLIGIHPTKSYTLFVQAHAGQAVGPRMRKISSVLWNTTAQKVQVWQRIDSIIGGIRTLDYGLKPGQEGTWRETIWRMKKGEEPRGSVL